ncbi:TonB family protein [Hoeflea olei]|uniref:Protein TonB n=1 Tax=Hoeflea olei TaxID=1480615 RepID=A0A1C1YUA2_9HYPH|nr:energy transducer TonB [Hoeflea olei]OCW56956.1 hypothetical protein AWJ14_07315 [Hoeflea olei]
MKLTRPKLVTAVTLSLVAHVATAAIFMPPEPEVQIAGGAEMSELVIGTAFEDSLMAGDPETVIKSTEAPSELQPVEDTLTAVETPPAEALTPATEETPDLARPDPVAELAPTPEATTAPSLVAALPAASEDLAALPEPSEIEPVDDPEPELALPEIVPVPVPRPAPPKTETAKVEKPAPKKTETPKPEPKSPSRKAAKAGDGGKQAVTASRAASGSADATRTTAAGNAAVSNYPGKVASKLRRSLRYPNEAKRRGVRGDVVVSFVVSANGGVSGIRIARSSGSPVLDGAAADAVRRAAPFPQIPSNAGRSTWPFSVPLRFTR